MINVKIMIYYNNKKSIFININWIYRNLIKKIRLNKYIIIYFLMISNIFEYLHLHHHYPHCYPPYYFHYFLQVV